MRTTDVTTETRSDRERYVRVVEGRRIRNIRLTRSLAVAVTVAFALAVVEAEAEDEGADVRRSSFSQNDIKADSVTVGGSDVVVEVVLHEASDEDGADDVVVDEDEVEVEDEDADEDEEDVKGGIELVRKFESITFGEIVVVVRVFDDEAKGLRLILDKELSLW